MSETLREVNIESMGFGRQTVAIAELAESGELPEMDVAIFADPQCERPETYDLKEKLEKRWRLNVVTTTRGNLEKDLLGAREKYGYQRVNIPAWTLDEDAEYVVPFSRGCTVDYKIKPVRKAARQFIGFTGKPVEGVRVNMILGMSVDETHRMRDSNVYWIKNKYPLIETKPLSAQRCTEILAERELTVPKSACFFCPYSSNAQWRSLKKEHPDMWKRSCELDEAIRDSEKAEHQLFLHKSRVPLEKADLTEPDNPQYDLFGNECYGTCGA